MSTIYPCLEREKSAIQDFYTLDEPGEESKELSSVGKR